MSTTKDTQRLKAYDAPWTSAEDGWGVAARRRTSESTLESCHRQSFQALFGKFQELTPPPAVAAKGMHVRRFIGFEVDESYLKVAAQNVGGKVS
jgi:hypothetical protein